MRAPSTGPIHSVKELAIVSRAAIAAMTLLSPAHHFARQFSPYHVYQQHFKISLHKYKKLLCILDLVCQKKNPYLFTVTCLMMLEGV